MSALPPAPIISPTEANTITTGQMMFTAASAVLPMKFDTKMPSTTVYSDVNIIIAMVGSVNRRRSPMLKCRSISLSIYRPYLSSRSGGGSELPELGAQRL